MPEDLPRLPATPEGLDAFSELVAQGRSAVIGPVFSPAGCDQALDRYLAGMEKLLAQGGKPDGVWEVEFGAEALSRAADGILRERLRFAAATTRAAYKLLEGRVGWAAALVARYRFERGLNSSRFESLKARGAIRPMLTPRQDGDYAEAKRVLDKLANYQIDLEALAEELTR